jgi:hypothetical protein
MPVSTSMRFLILKRHSGPFTAAVDHRPLPEWRHTLRKRADCRNYASASRGNLQRKFASLFCLSTNPPRLSSPEFFAQIPLQDLA